MQTLRRWSTLAHNQDLLAIFRRPQRRRIELPDQGPGGVLKGDDPTLIAGMSMMDADRLRVVGINTCHRLDGLSADEPEQLPASTGDEPPPDFETWLVSARA